MALVKFSSALFTAPPMAKSAEGVRAAAPMMLTTGPAPLSRSRGQGNGIAPLPEKGRDRATDSLAGSGHDGAATRHARFLTLLSGWARAPEPRRKSERGKRP